MRLPPAGVNIGIGTSLLGLALDREQEDLPESSLLLKGLSLSLMNLLILGPILHSWATQWMRPRRVIRNILDAFVIVTVHSGLYAVIHRCMHRVSALKSIHKDHHRFQKRVTPSAANAVSAQEFLLAYMFPFLFAVRWLKPDPIAFNAAVGVVSIFNLLVHSPHLQDTHWHRLLVHPKDHISHHSRRTPHYAAPTWAWM